jgi:hypothetical protein
MNLSGLLNMRGGILKNPFELKGVAIVASGVIRRDALL